MKRLLILDSCAQVRLVLTPFLGEQGYGLTFVSGAQSALDALWKEEFAAALVDATDAASGGEEFLAALRALAPSALPCVALVPEGDSAAEARLLSAGAAACLAKPFDYHEMTMLLARLTA